MSTQALGIGILLIAIGAGGLGYLIACLTRWTCPECERRFQARLDDAGRSEPW